jgi:ABC-type lipoprotein release transport system permease subunit
VKANLQEVKYFLNSDNDKRALLEVKLKQKRKKERQQKFIEREDKSHMVLSPWIRQRSNSIII